MRETPDLQDTLAEVVLPCADLAPALAFFTGQLGFRVETIFPAEEPTTASLSGHGLRLRLEPVAGDPGVIRLACAQPPSPRHVTAPNGTRIEWVDLDPPIVTPPFVPEFLIARQAHGAAGEGRAGMIYRDLIPGRLGGRYIASHITLPGAGPVADWVHYHKVRFQMIFCRRGWARLVYEDQGPAFMMAAGDCVLQPPRIRHRVLESGASFEVVEIGCPALHETLADHAMSLPTARRLPERDFSGQRFHHAVAAKTPWTAEGETGFERRETGMARASGGLADASVLRPGAAHDLAVPPHHGELMFGFLLNGSATLVRCGDHPLTSGDAFVIPPDEAWAIKGASDDLALLRVRA